jgi:hypothetical protein
MQQLLEFVVEAEKMGLHLYLQVITFILGGITTDLATLHGSG